MKRLWPASSTALVGTASSVPDTCCTLYFLFWNSKKALTDLRRQEYKLHANGLCALVVSCGIWQCSTFLLLVFLLLWSTGVVNAALLIQIQAKGLKLFFAPWAANCKLCNLYVTCPLGLWLCDPIQGNSLRIFLLLSIWSQQACDWL